MALARAIFKEDPSLDLIQVQDEIFELLEDEANRGGLAALEAIEKLVDDETEEAIKEIIKNGGNQISEQLSERLRQRSDYLVTGFDKHTREVMRSVLETEEPLTANEIRERLEAVLPYSKAQTIARNETVYAFKSGRLELDEQIAQKYDLVIELTWRTSPEAGDVCPLCEAMDGKKTLLGKAFTPVPVEVEKKDGTTEIKTWTPSEWNDQGCIPNAHTNCKCYFDETLVRTV
jgi:protein-tyrosine-phosphatase